MNRNCECCGANYESYTIGKDSEIFSRVCIVYNPKNELKGLCPFCNPKSKVWYNHDPKHVNESCRNNEVKTGEATSGTENS